LSEITEQVPSTVGPTTLLDLIRIVLEDPQLKPDEKRSLIDELRKNNPGTSDRWTYRYAILTLGGAVLITILALWYLGAHQGATIPDGLISIGSAAVGGLAGLLTPGRGTET
jgi:hypothetical protein